MGKHGRDLFPYKRETDRHLTVKQTIFGSALVIGIPYYILLAAIYVLWYCTSAVWSPSQIHSGISVTYVGIGISILAGFVYTRANSKFLAYWNNLKGLCTNVKSFASDLVNQTEKKISGDTMRKFNFVLKAIPYVVIWDLRNEAELDLLPMPDDVVDDISKFAAAETKTLAKVAVKGSTLISLRPNLHFSKFALRIMNDYLNMLLVDLENAGGIHPDRARDLRKYVNEWTRLYGELDNLKRTPFPRQFLQLTYIVVFVYFLFLAPVLIASLPVFAATLIYIVSSSLYVSIVVVSRAIEDPLLRHSDNLYASTLPISSVTDDAAIQVDSVFSRRYDSNGQSIDLRGVLEYVETEK